MSPATVTAIFAHDVTQALRQALVGVGAFLPLLTYERVRDPAHRQLVQEAWGLLSIEVEALDAGHETAPERLSDLPAHLHNVRQVIRIEAHTALYFATEDEKAQLEEALRSFESARRAISVAVDDMIMDAYDSE